MSRKKPRSPMGRLSHGEYRVKPETLKKYGDEVLSKLNEGPAPSSLAKLSPAVREITRAKEVREIIKSIKPLTLPHITMWLTNQLVDYEVRDDGIWLRDYNVRVATFSPNNHALRELLKMLLDEAYKFGKSLTDDQAEVLAKLPKVRARART